jgi:hypothetical protein
LEVSVVCDVLNQRLVVCWERNFLVCFEAVCVQVVLNQFVKARIKAGRDMSVFVGKRRENLALLEDMPTEVLLVIFKYCTLGDLGSLCKTCKRLNYVVTNFIWFGKSQKALVTNQISPDIRNR